MFLLKLIKKLFGVFRGSVSPIFIFLSILLGFWFGMVPGFSGFHILLIVIVLLLNVHIGLFLLSGALGRSLCYAAAPVLYHAGMWMQENIPFVLRTLESLPVIGLTDFSTYSVAGAFVIGPIVGAVVGLLMSGSVIKFRRMMLKFDEKSEKFRIWYSKKWVRILDRLLIGKRAKDVKAMFAKTKYIRKAGAILAILVIGGAVAAVIVLKDTKVKNYASDAMTKANGAEVNLESLGLSLAKGSVSASGLQVTDPENPANNQLAIEKIAADVSVYDLLLGKVIMEQVEVSNVQFNQLRAVPGKVIEANVPEEPEVFDPNDYDSNPTDIAKLEKYFKDAQALKEKLQKLKKYLPGGKDQEGQAEVEPEQTPQKYLEYLTARAAEAISPRVMAKLAIIDKVQIPSEIFGNSKIQLENLSDAPKAAALPITLLMNSLDNPASVNLTMDYSQPVPRLNGSFNAFDMSKFQSSLGSDSGIVFNSGTASGQISGTTTKEQIDLTLEIDIQDLNAAGSGDGVLGLGSEATTEALAVLKNIKTSIRIVGPVSEPRLVFDVDGLTEMFREALIAAGKERLMNEVDEQMGELNEQLSEQLDDQLGDNVPDEVKDVLGEPGGLLEGLGGGLFGGD
ncbi:hypothetical protein ACFLZ8_04910 [Planctomycetota bacterium]